MPSRFTCDGLNINPPLDIGRIPEHTKSIALIIDDPDAPHTTFIHWVVWNIPVTTHIEEDSIPGTEGRNDFHRNHYGGPCPPSGTHRYFFKVYALDSLLDLKAGSAKKELLEAMEGHILGYGELIGLYKRKS
jgi:Raf kinase inhibitor-like YbhB/YbcL family protein